MSDLRFEVGATVMCNMGSRGWRLGTIVALDYREAHWPAEKTAPYQVALEDDHTLIYVPEDDALFECELYLGHALTFHDAEVRHMAEQSLKGCYQKRQLKAARFMWIDGTRQMMRGEWAAAAETLRLAADKKGGWGWAVNYGDIWLSESAARLVHGAALAASNTTEGDDGAWWIAEAARLLEKAVARVEETRAFEPDGAPPFPPQPRPRRADAAELMRRMPGHNG